MHPARLATLLSALLACGGMSRADEGMWTFNRFPSQQVAAKYGFAPDTAWLDHLRLSSMRLAGGCSASVVSPQGLVMTNHHCARGCIEQLSGLRRKDYDRDGFLARSGAEEARCPGMELNQLIEIRDVGAQLAQATQGVAAEGFANAQKAAIAAIERECATSDALRCEVVKLYRGGRYDLYTYQRHQDVRLVFAPETAIANFGGDPDNFNFPRWNLDIAFLRVRGADGQPLATPQHLRWSDGTLREGDLTFVPGHPGGTARGYTVAQLQAERDVQLPKQIARAAELRGLLLQYAERGPEQMRHSAGMLDGVENWLKSMVGQQEALADPAWFAQLAARETALRERVAARPEWQQSYGGLWDGIAANIERGKALRKTYGALEGGPQSSLFGLARRLLRHAEETAKPNGERLEEYADARLPEVRHRVLAQVPVFDEFETALLSWSLSKLREDLGPDHPVVRRLFATRSPAQVAAAAVKGTQLKTLKLDAKGNVVGGLRKTLFEGGKAAVDASHDPMIELARSLDGAAREVRRRWETEVKGPRTQLEEQLARARFAVEGDASYPDATSTLRLSFGAVKGWTEGGREIAPFTLTGGAFERHTGADPFALPPSWLKAKGRLDLAQPFNFVTTNDIIGGNSGSPMVNRRGEVVGLVFDGNIHSLGGDYGFDERLNRTVGLHSAVVLEALDKVYGAAKLADEVRGTTVPAR